MMQKCWKKGVGGWEVQRHVFAHQCSLVLHLIFIFAFASLTSSIAGNGKSQMVHGNSGHKLYGSTAIYIKFPAPLTADVTPYQAQLKPTSHRSFISKPSISAKTT